MKVLITGGTGLIGSELITRLRDKYEISILSRQPKEAMERFGDGVQAFGSLDEVEQLSDFHGIINLQGEGIADKRWTAKQKQRLQESRWQVTEALSKRIQACDQPPKVFISGSAIGYYGAQGDKLMTEAKAVDLPDDFAHNLCQKWEALALSAQTEQTRVCVIRTGVVLAGEGSALQKMLPPYLLGLGGPLGSGKQYFSWIHLQDIARVIEFLLENGDCQGVYNATAPQPLPQEEFSESIARVLRKSHFMRVPAWALKLLLGEMSQMLLTGQRVTPARLQEAGFEFKFGSAEAALRDCLLPASSSSQNS
ncbi:Epimerase family protein [Pseudidiomarina piscicola]|uniref:Epimerase family protein n=1 Tax=Pseudidiomarina piscicola TaxID=2614830 RepID=A0A6S6WJF9_9GAMM|nr:TIGR01777 family oxidoreductase [Pseudidiomarina piscicola]CAB0149751.1 Epimerase family protein [Pseudidiomarina piscicola]VZT39199.1 Epimerase family protein [Pseudomonas aeruginosa]